MPRHRPRKGLSPDDPFGPDGFGDNWDCKPTVRTFASDSEEWPSLPADLTDRIDWGSAATRRRQQQAEKEAKQRKRQEDLRGYLVAKARMMKKKAALEAAAVGALMQQKAEEDATKKVAWNREVERAIDCIALADPVQALNIMLSLSLNNEILDHIDTKEKENVGQLYAALYNHYELQKSLPSTLANYYYLDHSSSEKDESSSDETTIGGDTVEVNRTNVDGEIDCELSEVIETCNATVVVDRLPQTDENKKDNSSINKSSDCSHQTTEEENNIESQATAVVIDREGLFSTHRNVNEITTKRVNAANRLLQHAFDQSLELLEGIMQQYEKELTVRGKQDIERQISIQREQLNLYRS